LNQAKTKTVQLLKGENNYLIQNQGLTVIHGEKEDRVIKIYY
jgi:hypothetical protein